jgi:hypothetical protein
MAKRDARRKAARAVTKPMERQVVGEKDEQGSEPPKWFMEASRRRREVWNNNPRHDELMHQKIRLKGSGVEMEWGVAQAAVEGLRIVQEKTADDFATLVALAKPSGATRLPSKVSRKALASVVENQPHIVDPDGSLDEDYAKVLEAAYEETKDGVILRDPVAYSREFVEKWAPIDRKVQSELERIDRLAAKAAREERRKRRGEGEEPSR